MDKAYQTLGIAYISKNLVLGQDEVVNAIRKNKVSLVLVSNTASENTKKVVTDKSKYYQIKYMIIDDDGKLTKAIGKKNVKVLAIKNQKLANSVYNQLKEK